MKEPARRRLWRQIGEVALEVPVLPGDDQLSDPQLRATRAITIEAPAELTVVLLEFGDFAMNRRMMRGITSRAESLVCVGQPSDAREGKPPCPRAS
jgi:hypothetical protein